MIFSEFRKIFWITSTILYVTPFIFNLFNEDSLIYSLAFFVIYLFLFIIYFFTEDLDHYRHVTVTLTIISICIYPILYSPTYQAGIFLDFKLHEKEYNEFVSKVDCIKNVESLGIDLISENKNSLNGELLKDDKYIFENFGVKETAYYEIRNEMKKLNIRNIIKEKNVFFIDSRNLRLVYYYETSNMSISKNEIHLGNNWFAYDF